ncbi:MAG: MBL fold metallo-hydrolase [Candidatus Parcubacteria bacterium]|nr:MBL fold metallo-hydrolase [Candidatus Parcubacteria bacterium]
MVITYYGAACFKVQSGDTVLAFSPPSKESKFKAPRFQTDIALINPNNPDYGGRDVLSAKDEKKPIFIIDGAGEYEVSGIYIRGISNPVIYMVSFENISLCHLGAFAEKNISPEIKEEIGEVDILFIPIDKDDGQKAAQLISQIEPKIAIPMNYKEADLKQFLKEFGNGSAKPEEKLTIKKKDLSEEKTQVVVLSPAI